MIQQLRSARNITMREFARKAGIAHGNLHAIETEKNSPSVDAFRNVAEALGLKGWQLLKTIEEAEIDSDRENHQV